VSEANGRYQAVVFDMDGVLVDSEPAFFEGVNKILEPAGKRIEWERYKQLLGTSTSHTWRNVLEIVGLDPETAKPYAEQYGGVMLELLGQPRSPLPGVEPLITSLRERGTPIGIATSSWREWMEALLGGAGLPLDNFDALVWREMVAKSKPAPDLYLKAAELLGMPAKECIAVEDTVPGIAAAKAAGMFAVQVRAASSAGPPIEQADLVIESLEEFPLAMIDAWG
jgi:HAD superfamily hydrolase (TIGR01509 family)